MTADPAPGVLTERSARIVAAHKLLRRARRRQAGEFLADGAQAVREAVRATVGGPAAAGPGAPGPVVELYVTEAAATKHVEVVRAALNGGIAVSEVTDRAASRLSDAVTPQGITARCALPDDGPGTLLTAGAGLVAVLVEPADPGNAGTVIRLADAAGADGVIVAGDAVDPWGPKAVRASAGSIFHLPVVRVVELGDLLPALSAAGLQALATTGHAAADLDRVRADGLLALPTAWLFGSEAHGLPADLVTAADLAVRVPIHGRAESLNLATAAAVCLYASASVRRSAP